MGDRYSVNKPNVGYTTMLISANGTYDIVPAATKIKFQKVFIGDPSDSGGTISIQDRNNSNVEYFNCLATQQGQHECEYDQYVVYSGADNVTYKTPGGLRVVVASATGTFKINISWKEQH